jgi:hypothetical protein
MIPLICGRNITHEWYDNEDLSLSRYLSFDSSRDDVTVLVTHSHIDLLPPQRGGVHERQVAEIGHAHLKGAGNGGGRQCKYVRAAGDCLCI